MAGEMYESALKREGESKNSVFFFSLNLTHPQIAIQFYFKEVEKDNGKRGCSQKNMLLSPERASGVREEAIPLV